MYADIGLAKDQRNLWFNVMLMSNGNGNAMVMTHGHGHGHGSNDRSFNDTCMMDRKVWCVTDDDTARHNKCANLFLLNACFDRRPHIYIMSKLYCSGIAYRLRLEADEFECIRSAAPPTPARA